MNIENGIPTEKARIIRTLARVYEDKPEEFMSYCRELGYSDGTIAAGLLKYYGKDQKSKYVWVIKAGVKSVQEIVDQYDAARNGALREQFLKAFNFTKGQRG